MEEAFVTKNHFDKTLNNIDKRFDKMDRKIDEKFDYLDEKINSVLEAVNFGFQNNEKEHQKFLEADKMLQKKIDNIYNMLDGYIKSREDSGQEFMILKHRVDVVEEKVGIDR